MPDTHALGGEESLSKIRRTYKPGEHSSKRIPGFSKAMDNKGLLSMSTELKNAVTPKSYTGGSQRLTPRSHDNLTGKGRTLEAPKCKTIPQHRQSCG